MGAALELSETVKIGENDHGYAFYVGRWADAEDRWIGFAVGDLGAGEAGMFVFPQVARGYLLGLEDRDEAIRLTGAIAQAPESGYGGIKRWTVPAELRADPDDYRCEHCDQVGCDGTLCASDECDEFEDPE